MVVLTVQALRLGLGAGHSRPTAPKAWVVQPGGGGVCMCLLGRKVPRSHRWPFGFTHRVEHFDPGMMVRIQGSAPCTGCVEGTLLQGQSLTYFQKEKK